MKFKIPHIFSTSALRAAVTTTIVAVGIIFAVTASAEPRRKSKSQTKATREFTVVIDAGHGGHDHGAIDNGATEKSINLGVAKKFAALVKKKMKDVKVVMTRDDDTFISLQERANIANRNKGNLFISIHTNSVDKSNPNRKTVSGTSVYALGPQKDANNLKVAQRENAVIELEDNYHQKYSGFDPSKDESYIIFEMAQKKNLGQSLKFADKAQKELVKTAGRKDRGVKQAGFWVLWATSMPSVLVELDFICNPTQAKYLSSEAGQQELAQSLFNALESYIKSLHNPTAAAEPAMKNPDPQTEETFTASAEPQPDSGGVNTLASSAQEKKSERQHIARTKTSRSGSTPRKRRSGTARKISDNRVVETESITLKSETDFLAVQEQKKEEVKTPEPVADDTDSDKKSKKQKKKKDKKSKQSSSKKESSSKKKDKKKDNKKAQDRPKSGKRTFVVKNNSGNIAASKGDDAKTDGSTATKAAAAKMVYKIQLLASETEIAENDPAFCGLVPSGKFHENGLYKYTYGASESRREIEQKLLEVKSLIPDAFIVVRIE